MGAGASEHHLAFPPRVQWFSQCLAMLSLGAVQLVVPNTQGAGIMAPPFVSGKFLASALAMMLLLTPRLAGDRPVASDVIAAHGGDVACIPYVAPPMNSIVVPAAPCDPGQAPLSSTPLQRSSATPQIVDDALVVVGRRTHGDDALPSGDATRRPPSART